MGPKIRQRVAIAAVGAVVAMHVSNADAATLRHSTNFKDAPVAVGVVESKTFTDWHVYSGHLEPVERVEVRPRVAGEIQSVYFQEGALVHRNDLLFTIDPAPYQAKVAMAEGNAAIARASFASATIEVERGRKMVNNLISQSEFDQRENALSEAKARLNFAEAALRLAQLDLDYTQVRAPIDGRVGKIEVGPGNMVAQGAASPALTRLVSTDKIYVSFKADRGEIEKTVGAFPADASLIGNIPIEIDRISSGGISIPAKLEFIDNEVDGGTGTVALRAIATNLDHRLTLGESVQVRMGRTTGVSKVIVRESAVGTNHGKKFVLVVDRDDSLHYREIHLGTLRDGVRVVDSGLSAGETIVLDGVERLRFKHAIAYGDHKIH